MNWETGSVSAKRNISQRGKAEMHQESRDARVLQGKEDVNGCNFNSSVLIVCCS